MSSSEWLSSQEAKVIHSYYRIISAESWRCKLFSERDETLILVEVPPADLKKVVKRFVGCIADRETWSMTSI